jgi:hypothetical protein
VWVGGEWGVGGGGGGRAREDGPGIMRVGEFCVVSTGGTGGRDREKCGIMQNEEQGYRRRECLCVCV